MKITKYVHSCLLVETPDRVALFDPGSMSEQALDIDGIDRLHDIFITHEHGDHFSPELIKKLVEKFPDVCITGTNAVVEKLSVESIRAGIVAPEGAHFFDSPHEDVEPLFPHPEEIGVHYLDMLSHPGDSHSFKETKSILALPVSGPWASTIKAINLAIDLKPRHVLPIHDWHWREEARLQMYDIIEGALAERDITFHKLETGQPIEIAVDLQTGPKAGPHTNVKAAM